MSGKVEEAGAASRIPQIAQEASALMRVAIETAEVEQGKRLGIGRHDLASSG
jgi:hypothetical protein